MKKRTFLKNLGLGAITLTGLPQKSVAKTSDSNESKLKNWVWVNPDHKEKEEVLKERYAKFKANGITGVFFEADDEKHFTIAKQQGLSTHRWIWTLNRGEESLLKAHPEWYAHNRKGESCATQPPYVNYYRWLCPSRPEVHSYLENIVKTELSKPYVDGIHLDYVRYCDVILPVALWKNYGIKQNQELPQYDYCYCKVCQEKFKEKKGIDILSLENPDQNLSWRKFRYDNVTRLVNHLSATAASFKKPITAAVFPTPEVAKRIVRQDWTNWNLSAVCPMIYHRFYEEDVQWIGDAVEEGVRILHGKFPLYAGLFLPDFKSQEELETGITLALKNGASGVSLFGNVDDKVLAALSKVVKTK
ncbi:Glycosyl hydrolase-like 10 [Pseudarcicella hirudinis]|uniref:Glycosyl hydrolase-like 10 n=1 Tax=Pseudarcicella hirudinis TaxID=1079859 RepID=A0A1I5P8B3_9BACT|nr:family 10 glycosylhydrolase [Pseudarcicella hirudinis]SFP30203.1 Glycosyl hydrolase-like 10 [Pseudarcicella hirudinis]